MIFNLLSLVVVSAALIAQMQSPVGEYSPVDKTGSTTQSSRNTECCASSPKSESGAIDKSYRATLSPFAQDDLYLARQSVLSAVRKALEEEVTIHLSGLSKPIRPYSYCGRRPHCPCRLFDNVVEHVSKTMGCHTTMLTLIDEDRKKLKNKLVLPDGQNEACLEFIINEESIEYAVYRLNCARGKLDPGTGVDECTFDGEERYQNGKLEHSITVAFHLKRTGDKERPYEDKMPSAVKAGIIHDLVDAVNDIRSIARQEGFEDEAILSNEIYNKTTREIQKIITEYRRQSRLVDNSHILNVKIIGQDRKNILTVLCGRSGAPDFGHIRIAEFVGKAVKRLQDTGLVDE